MSDDRLTAFVAIIDYIEVYLDIGTDSPSLRERLEVVRGGTINKEHLDVLADATERLCKVEVSLADFWKGGRPSG
jgi:hypothetical protein